MTADRGWLTYATRASTRFTCSADQTPRPLAVGTPRAFSPFANACSVTAPAARISAMMGAKSCARASALAARAAALAALPRAA